VSSARNTFLYIWSYVNYALTDRIGYSLNLFTLW